MGTAIGSLSFTLQKNPSISKKTQLISLHSIKIVGRLRSLIKGEKFLLRFPDSNTIFEKVSINLLLQPDYNEEKGITKAVAELAAARLANSYKEEHSYKEELGVKMEVHLLIKAIQSGKIRAKEVPNLCTLEWPTIVWQQISIATQNALLDCAEKV